MKFRDSASLVGEWMKRLVIIQLGGRAMRNAVDKLNYLQVKPVGDQGDDSAFV